MELAVTSDVRRALGRDLTATESSRVAFLIRRASAMVVGHCGQVPVDPDTGDAPEDVADTVAGMVARVLERASVAGVPPGATQIQQSAGPFSQGVTFAPGGNSFGPWLEKSDRLALAPYRDGGGMRAVGIDSGRTGIYRREA